jgi:hypothetical protein
LLKNMRASDYELALNTKNLLIEVHCDMAMINLQFQTSDDLTNFQTAMSNKLFIVDEARLRLSCNCTDSDVSIAQENFCATVIKTIRFVN